MAALMVEGGHLNMAIFLLVAVSTYARPSELLRLRTFSLIRPAVGITGSWSLLMSPEELQQPSKTGDFDVSVLLDSPYMISWASKIFSAMKETEAEAPLWNFNYSQYLRIFQASAKKLGLPLQPYHTRHSGPSIDRSRKYRSQLEVQKRGQWRSTKSTVRYEKSARLARSWEQVSQLSKDFCVTCEEEIGGIILSRKVPPSSASLAALQKVSM